jgi:GDPmannose 4,6-dehydratase
MDALRDWGHAKDYVEMQWLMLQQEKPVDFVIATGEQHSVREFVEAAAEALDIPIYWKGKGKDEKGYNSETGECIIEVDSRYYRPTEVETLLGDPTKAKRELGWEPRVTFAELVQEMAQKDLQEAEMEDLCRRNGFEFPQPQE